jgi:hypothetical protein
MNVVGISLGMNCDAAVWGVENGVRMTKAKGYKTCPFDEMISNYPGLIECIKDNFKYFCDPNYLTLIETTDVPYIYNTKYKFIYNHESPGHANLHITEKWPEGKNHYINNNYKHFIERYTQRIQSFRNYLSCSKNVITFIISRYNTLQTDLVELHEALRMHYPNLSYHIKPLFITNERVRNTLRLMKFDEDHPEMVRLNYWYE